MGAFVKLLDFLLFLFFLFIAVVAPLIDFQSIFPRHFYPDLLIDLKQSYSREYGDYLVAEKPHFFVGIVWLELLFQWPLALLNLYGILGSKTWFHTTSLIYGASVVTSMVAILSELMNSGRASDKLIMLYFPFICFGILAILRGLIPHSGKTDPVTGKRPAIPRKKRA